MVDASGWGPVVGDGDGLANRSRAARRAATASSSPPTATARRSGWRELLREPRPRLRRRRRATTDLTEPGGHVVVAPLHRGCSLPAARLADHRRGRPHRPAPHAPPAPAPQARGGRLLRGPEARQLRRPLPARRRPATRAWSSARSAASSATTCCSPTRAATSSTSRATRSTRIRHYVGGEAPGAAPPRRRRLRQGQGAGHSRPSARSPRSWSCSTRSGSTPRATRSGPTRRGSTSMEDAFPYVETPDQRTAIDDVKADMERAVPDGPPGVRRRRLRQDRGRHPRRVQGDPGRQAGGRARAHDAAGQAARQHVRRPLRRLPDPRRGAQPLPHQRARPRR